MTTLTFHDLSPYNGPLSTADDQWLAQVSEIDPREMRIGIDAERIDDDEWAPLVEKRSDNLWWAGRYVGSIVVSGRRLTIEPRMGISVIDSWLDQAFGLFETPASAASTKSEEFLVRLLARLWCRVVGQAARHGLPALRLPVSHTGDFVRGRLDVAGTLMVSAKGDPRVVSTMYERSLANTITRAIVCADRALDKQLSPGRPWRSDQIRQAMPQLRAAVGSAPRLPRPNELKGVRYTPITLQYRQAAEMSVRIASGLGYGTVSNDSNAEGILIDLAELWELFVLNCTRRAIPASFTVSHGTRIGERAYLLQSIQNPRTMGLLKPDILIKDGDQTVAVLDAKYKRLQASKQRPNGVDTADLYQLNAYATHFRPAVAALIYPQTDALAAPAENFGPWQDGNTEHRFVRVATDSGGCQHDIGQLLNFGC